MITQRELVELFAEGIERRGYFTLIHEDWLEHRDSGLAIYPRAIEPDLSSSFVRSVVIVTADHPRFPLDGIVEYQHAVAATQKQAICDGLDQWLQMDFTVLLDALAERPKTCSMLEFRYDESPGRVRRVLLGPIGHLITQPERASKNDKHPFCPCCLFTNTHEAFQSHLGADGLYAIRFFVSRDEGGLAEADCRINGEDWEAGKQALRAYAETWPQAGLEIRKQYVVMQSVHHDA